MKRWFAFILLSCICAVHAASEEPPTNTISLKNDAATSVPAHTVSISRPFREGEVPRCPSAFHGEVRLETQSDIKNRWPDGSVKFAIVSFSVPAIAGRGGITVRFADTACSVDRTTRNESAKAILAKFPDFDAGITISASEQHRISARDLLEKGKFKTWLNGPLVFAVVAEDLSPERSSDLGFGNERPLHAVFEIWFYPNDQRYEVGYTLENTWASSNAIKSARDVSYSFKLDLGIDRKMVFENPKFDHAAFSRWHKTFFSSTSPTTLIDHNARYLLSTGAVPHWNGELKIAPSLISNTIKKWKSVNHEIGGNGGQLGNYSVEMNAGGAADWIGLAPTWDILYLLTSRPELKEITFGNADLAGAMPYHFREADVRPRTNADSPSFGKIVSVDVRHEVTLSDLSENCSGTSKGDVINVPQPRKQQWPSDLSHMPDIAYLPYLLSGKYYYLSELQYQAGFILGTKLGCASGNFARQGSLGLINESQLRGEAWGLRTLSYAAFISPDATSEKHYFEDKLLNNIVELEGIHGLPSSDSKRSASYNWGRDKSVRSQVKNPPPLRFWEDRGPEFIQAPLKQDGSLTGAASPWEENFLVCSLGLARQFGYPTKTLLTYLAYRPFNTLLNPKVGHPVLIEAYRYPTKVAPGGKWVSDWSAFSSYYATIPTEWQTKGNIDHSYGFIAMSAISYLYDLSVDGYTGKQAWDLMVAKKPEQERLATESPKWSITPLVR